MTDAGAKTHQPRMAGSGEKKPEMSGCERDDGRESEASTTAEWNAPPPKLGASL